MGTPRVIRSRVALYSTEEGGGIPKTNTLCLASFAVVPIPDLKRFNFFVVHEWLSLDSLKYELKRF